MAGKIKDKLRKRDRIFAALDRHVVFLEEYDPETKKGQVQSRLDKLEASSEEFNELQEDLSEVDTKGELEDDITKAYADFEERYYEIRASLLGKLEPPPSPANLDNTIGRNNGALGAHTGVRLPQISLPEFNGDFKGWLSFKSTFVSLIHDSNELSDVQKFHYLKSALKGEAAKLIESLTITNGNYMIAWDTISKRYSNEYLLKKRHLQALMEFPRIEKETAGRIHRLVDEFDQRLKILKQLGEKTEHWGAMIIHWMCSKLDSRTSQLWEDHAASIKEPTFSVLVDFLEKRTRVLDAVLSNANNGSVQPKTIMKRERIAVHASSEGGRNEPTCLCCGDLHYLVRCSKFQDLGLKEKLDFVNGKRLCSNCFKTGHWVRDCNSKFSCKKCGKKHNTLIHPGFQPAKATSGSSEDNESTTGRKSDVARMHIAAEITDGRDSDAAEGSTAGSYSVGTKKNSLSSRVFLSTVVVAIHDQNGNKQLARALLDNGSQVNVLSERLCQMLKLKRRRICIPITGVGQSESTARHAVSTTVHSRVSDFSIGLDFLVLQRVTAELPSATVPISHWNIPPNLQMADPQFNFSGRIDLLLGAEHFFGFLVDREVKKMVLGPKLPILVNSVFGWIVSGRDESIPRKRTVRCCTATTTEKLEELIEKFWRVDGCEDQPAWSKEEQECEEDFKRTHSRSENGRYIIKLPKHTNWDRMLGNSRAMALDRYRKLEKRLERNQNMKEQYHSFMKEYLFMQHMRKISDLELQSEVQEPDRRKVFYLPHHAVIKEASTTTKVRVVFDASAQDEPIGVYELLTVTYGLTPSSFLATRVLKQLAEDEGMEGNKARSVLEKDFYVDDYIGGAPSVDEAIELREDLTSLMNKGGFPIRITWEPKADQLRFLYNVGDDEGEWTRRRILAAIAKLFDPLGIISPVVVTAKIIMQELALLQTGWDAPVPPQLEQKWINFHSRLFKLADFSIPRFCFIPDYVDVQLHCFADASDLAYGACMYIRSINRQGNVRVELLSSKSRVAPLKRLTIPRLELCAAREAARLYQAVIKALALDHIRSFFWSDSTVVLHWLRAPPNSWKTFIANRVSVIQTATYGHLWLHVAGKENPADLVSRGMPIEDFLISDLWKQGPSWLKQEPLKWQTDISISVPEETDLESRVLAPIAITTATPPHRRAAPLKCYISVFICFTTKAIHLELVMDLSTAGFLSALRRFVGHHGIPSQIHSDNATNFQGAKHELRDLYRGLNSKAGQQAIGSELSQLGISWHMIPPRAPNFGGLWEAAVRSAKICLKKEIGNNQLSHENFCTLLVQISATLNSRPLAPLSDDPNDFEALTPAHFLIGSSMKALPDPDLTAIPTNRLAHYQQRQQLFQRYWQRWSQEYITGLQQSTKNLHQSIIRIGSIVILREDNVPPLQWPLARIVDLHPGADGVVRVVTIRTTRGTYKRPVNRICPLPLEDTGTLAEL
ncbi:uncharacterized protein LOC129772927 [Toxorhynchites rutilus septentrionalis]|uniref:uncharacterized protein LOC129772927 n=1 Tax=Toxorhynchites rutilus septentrionalis TaxID=329112 RepID=UPI00247989D6|nr:uncharacterized protein LOC129772927 [Toxorhynchites rutilus septentrionalis]